MNDCLQMIAAGQDRTNVRIYNNIYNNNNNITNLLTGYTFQHRHAVINMCPVKE